MAVKTESSLLQTPMLKQYQEIKSNYQDAILFFRLGDFYEMFLDDAKVASRELNLTLTGRGKDENRIPMCGVPFHASESYVTKLVGKGYKVAICEQVEAADASKGITKREVVQVLTPGTVLGADMIDAAENNYLAAIFPLKKRGYAVSFTDISTGEFRLLTADSEVDIQILINRLHITEVLIPEDFSLVCLSDLSTTKVPVLESDRAEEKLCEHFELASLSTFGIGELNDCFPAAWAIINYLKETQKHAVPQLTQLLAYEANAYMSLDTASIRNLELIEGLTATQRTASLFGVLNHTKTAMGARKLKFTLKHPLKSIEAIEKRLDAVGSLVGDLLSREEIRECLTAVYDLERLTSRVVSSHHNPRDLLALKHSLLSLKHLPSILQHLEGSFWEEYTTFFEQFHQETSEYSKLIDLIEKSILEDSPSVIRDGNFIKDGFDEELDQLKASFQSIKEWIAGLEEIERKRTGISSLKVGFNKVFGYYFHISNTHKDKVPDEYIRKQTLTNGERFVTPELKEKETILLHGEEKQRKREIEIYETLVQKVTAFTDALQKCAEIIAMMDTFQSFATAAQKNNYSRPTFVKEGSPFLDIQDSRHPVLEKNNSGPVVSNSLSMTPDNNQFILITGPNMAGKSTVMKQMALLVIMAQSGCFVPAVSAKMSIVDKLFTRIGASDNLYAGQSTFMVEMLETATICHNATENSLILLDEVGRGTSTYDGISIAGALIRYIHTQIGARTLFATHYHELTPMTKELKGLSNFTMSIEEDKQNIAFTYQLIPGAADKSYGIHVAKMAGLPTTLIKDAKTMLKNFETQSQTAPSQQMSLF